MIVTPLPGRGSPAVLGALLSVGWEGTVAEVSASGLEPWGYHVEGASREALEALLGAAARYGLDLLTGEDWAVLTGTRSRLSAMARSWSLPPELGELALRIGQGLPADTPPFWRVLSGPVGLVKGPVFLASSAVSGAHSILPHEYVECCLPGGDTNAVAAEAASSGAGMLLTFASPASALDSLDGALAAASLAALDPAQMAVDTGWGASPTECDLARFRAFGCTLVTTTDSPVIAALAWERGSRVFRTKAAAELLPALMTTASLTP